jgi:hypothetical protein
MPPILRSVLAVLAGLLAMAVIVMALTLLSVFALHLKSGRPTPGYLTLNVIYSLAAAVFGGWLTARLAGRSPIAHGIALAVVMLVLSAVSYLQSTGTQPIAYQVFLVLMPPVAAIAGAWLSRRCVPYP